MKKIIGALFLYAMLISSCSSDFKVGADYRDITTVYSLLSMSDTAHYVKINKGFYSETENNLVIAQNSDSLFFTNLEVKIEEMSNGNIVKTHLLDKVDLVNEGYVKDSGVFATTPNYAYKLKQTLNPANLHHLVIKNLSTGKIIDGFTNVINDQAFTVQFPKPVDQLSLFDPNKSTPFSWSNPAGASFFDLYIRFYYQEKNVSTNEITYQYKDLPIAKNIPATSAQISSLVRMETFYGVLNSAIPFNSNVVRYVDTPDVIIYAGGVDLKTYIDVNTAQGGITADQIKPNYTNLKVDGIANTKDVFGIFSTRAREYVFQVPFDGNTIDYIKNGALSKNLNFIGISTQ